MTFRKGVAKRYIEFPPFEGNWIAVVLDADDQLFRLRPWHADNSQSRYLILTSLRPIPLASYQCTSARCTEPSATRTRAIPCSCANDPVHRPLLTGRARECR